MLAPRARFSRGAVRSLLRRYREPIFVALLLAGPCLVCAARWSPLPLQVANRAIVAMTAPVERALTLAVGGMLDTWTGYVWLHDVRQANVELRRQLLRERQQSQRAAELLAENARLQGLLDFADNERAARRGGGLARGRGRHRRADHRRLRGRPAHHQPALRRAGAVAAQPQPQH